MVRKGNQLRVNYSQDWICHWYYFHTQYWHSGWVNFSDHFIFKFVILFKRYQLNVVPAPSSPSPSFFNFTAVLNCRCGPHKKSWKIGWGLLDLKSRPSPHCWVRRNSRGSTPFLFRTSRSWFPRTVNDGESSIAAYKVQCTPPAGTQGPPAGTQGPPAGTQGFSSKLFDLSADFNEWPLVGKLEILAKRGRHVCSNVAKEMNDSAVFKEGPLEAILVIFGRRALIFLFEALGKIWKMTPLLCACAVVITLETQKMSKKGTSLRRI